MADVERQLPVGTEIFLDHVGHFVRDPQAASAALSRAGFAPTAVSVQVSPDAAGKPQPTGTGNVTAMFRRGYMEVLFKTADTPLGLEFAASLEAFSGLHLAAFSVADAEAAHARLAASSFAMRPLVYFERPVTTASGSSGTAAFTVTRVERGAMAEGRIQILTHRTEDMVWQPRWLDHPNGATALSDLVIAVDDLDEAAERFARFTGRGAATRGQGRSIRLDRGRVELMTRTELAALLPEVKIPRLPFMAGYAVRVTSLERAEMVLRDGGIAARRAGEVVVAPFPADLGTGAWVFVERAEALPWRRSG
jgi:Glyoxalase-like domain